MTIGDYQQRRPSVAVEKDRYIFRANCRGITLHPTIAFSDHIDTFTVRLLNETLQPLISKDILTVNSFYSTTNISRKQFTTTVQHRTNQDMYYYIEFKLPPHHELEGQKLFLEITGESKGYTILENIALLPARLQLVIPFTLQRTLKRGCHNLIRKSGEAVGGVVNKRYCCKHVHVVSPKNIVMRQRIKFKRS
jgi:hypothetical protein